jgi:FkbM family methyltransferase
VGEISEETKRVIALWNKPNGPMPPWWVWTGGWYECNGEKDYYFKHNLAPDSIVLEAGSYRGKFAAGIAERYDCRVEGYEPSTFSYRAALEKTAPYPKVKIHNLGLSDKDEERTLYDTHRDSSNLFTPGEGWPETVKLLDVSKVVQDLGHVDLFSINCEGWEFYIFPRLFETESICLLGRIMIQWHSVVDDAFAHQVQIQSTLAKTHKMEWNLGAWELWSPK